MIVLGILLVLLKVTHILDISWVLVLAPFWVPLRVDRSRRSPRSLACEPA